MHAVEAAEHGAGIAGNDFVQQICAVEDENCNADEFLRDTYKQKKAAAMESLREELDKYLGSGIVCTDAWIGSADECEVEENGLLQGEISAAIFSVGCYTVRSAQRVYKIHEPGYSPELEMPADEADIGLLKKDFEHHEAGISTGVGIGKVSWEDKLRVVHEILARHNSDPDNTFTEICRATHARNYTWSERIQGIFAVKENEMVPDEYASLLVHEVYSGSSFSADTWYRLEPTGKITKLELHPFDSEPDKARFV